MKTDPKAKNMPKYLMLLLSGWSPPLGAVLHIRQVGREADMINKDSIKFYNKAYKPLKGAKIVDFNMVKCEFDPNTYWPTFTLQQGSDKFNFVLSQDEEGNGGGFAFIEDVKNA